MAEDVGVEPTPVLPGPQFSKLADFRYRNLP